MKSFGRLDSRSGMLARRGFVVLWFSHNVKCMASNWFYVSTGVCICMCETGGVGARRAFAYRPWSGCDGGPEM